jgi:hypothetical protein
MVIASDAPARRVVGTHARAGVDTPHSYKENDTMTTNDLMYNVGEQVQLLRPVDSTDQLYVARIVEIDADDSEYPYFVEFGDERCRWVSEDDMDFIPTLGQVKQFAQLVNRVHEKISQE